MLRSSSAVKLKVEAQLEIFFVVKSQDTIILLVFSVKVKEKFKIRDHKINAVKKVSVKVFTADVTT